MRLKTLKQCAQILHKKVDKDKEITGFSVDTRTLKPGEIYFALSGSKVDGHLFVDEAFSKGAAFAVVGQEFKNTSQTLLRVDDVVIALQQLAKACFALNRPRFVIAITGSNGKTTTKDFLSTLLEDNFKLFKSPGNCNSQVGLPLALLNHFWEGEEGAILEMGMSKKGEILRLVDVAPPDLALLTHIGLSHAENFSTFSEIVEAKKEIFSHPKTTQGVYPKELASLLQLKKRSSLEGRDFSLKDPNADYSFLRCGDKSIFRALGVEFSFPKTRFIGEHNLQNLLAALSAIHMLGLSLEEVRKKIPYLKLPEKRLESILKKGVLFINDSYNSSMDSAVAALKYLQGIDGRKKWAVMGSMLELGSFSEECHKNVAQEALETIDILLCLGEECIPMIKLWEERGREAMLMQSHEEIINKLHQLVMPGDIVLLKGAQSKMMWKVVEGF